MVGTNWVFTLAQASATFVAIVGAFFTAKILSIASEKQTLRNRMSVIDAELLNRKKLQAEYKAKIDSIRRQWAEESVTKFFDWLKLSWSVGEFKEPPTIETVFGFFNEKEKREPDNDEKQIIQSRYSSLKSEIEKQIQKEKEEREHPSLIARLRPLEVGIPVLPEVALESARAEAANMRDLRSKYEQETNSITIQEGTKKIYRDQINALAFPAYAIFGFLSLVYFAAVGVVVPLMYALYVPVIDEATSDLLLSFFISGLILVFAYFYLEIRAALAKEPDTTESNVISAKTQRTEELVPRSKGATRFLRIVTNFAIGVAFFVVGGWFGQWGFTWNLRNVMKDIFNSRQFRAVPFATMGNYGYNWHTAFFIGCPVSSYGCVGDIPAQYVIGQDAIFLGVSVLEILWFCYLLWRSFNVQ